MSLRRRLLLMAGVVLLAFLCLTGGILDQAFRRSLDQAQRDRLQGVLYTILAAADLKDGDLQVPPDLPEARLSTPASGLYAQVIGAGGDGWRSPSLLGHSWRPELRLPPGETLFQEAQADGEALFQLAYGLSWEDAQGREAEFTIHVAESQSSYRAELAAFRASLWGWLGAATLALLLAQFAVLRWSLRPLQQVAIDLRAIEQGRADQLSGRYPAEITGLTDSLNALLQSERGRAQRYRDTLANLAHSLKTPLAVLRGALESQPLPPPDALEQIARIDAAIEYQLKRAASASRDPLAAPLPVKPVLERLLRTLAKAYRDKPLEQELRADPAAAFHGSEGDLMELAGNLLDNAHKWARTHVRATAQVIPAARGRQGLLLVVEDDGPGIAPEDADAVLERGRRADEQVQGHGIGLAVVSEIVRAHQGSLSIDRSELGGARLRIELPHG